MMLRSMILYDTRRPSMMAKQYDNLDDNGEHGDKDDRYSAVCACSLVLILYLIYHVYTYLYI